MEMHAGKEQARSQDKNRKNVLLVLFSPTTFCLSLFVFIRNQLKDKAIY